MGRRGTSEAECRKRKKDEAASGRSEMALTTTSSSPHSMEWIMDSGATSHMTFDKDLLANRIELHPTHPVQLGDGRILQATAMGDVLLRTQLVEARSR